MFDLKTLKVTKKIETGQNPDAILYHAPTHSVFVFNGQSHNVTVIDAVTQVAVATIPLAGKPEFAVADDQREYLRKHCRQEHHDRNRCAVPERSRLYGRLLPVTNPRGWQLIEAQAPHSRPAVISCL